MQKRLSTAELLHSASLTGRCGRGFWRRKQTPARCCHTGGRRRGHPGSPFGCVFGRQSCLQSRLVFSPKGWTCGSIQVHEKWMDPLAVCHCRPSYRRHLLWNLTRLLVEWPWNAFLWDQIWERASFSHHREVCHSNPMPGAPWKPRAASLVWRFYTCAHTHTICLCGCGAADAYGQHLFCNSQRMSNSEKQCEWPRGDESKNAHVHHWSRRCIQGSLKPSWLYLEKKRLGMKVDGWEVWRQRIPLKLMKLFVWKTEASSN